MFTLRAEIIACLFAVSLLGLLAGWMMQRVRMARRIDDTAAQWESRFAALEQTTRQDEQNLLDRLQQLGDELKTARSENQTLLAASRTVDDSAETIRAESIEMNRRHAEVQERLQRTLRDREREIESLQDRLAERGETVAPSRPKRRAAVAEPGSEHDVLDATVRIDPTQLPGAAVAATAIAPATAGSQNSHVEEELLGATLDEEYLDDEESTIALDEEALALVHGLQAGRKR